MTDKVPAFCTRKWSMLGIGAQPLQDRRRSKE